MLQSKFESASQPERRRKLFKTSKPKKKKHPPEWRIQAAVVADFHKAQDAGLNFEFAGDMNAGKRNGARAKLCGLKAGETDLRLYIPRGRLKMIELKAHKGELSLAQRLRHKKLRELGFQIETVQADYPDEAVTKCRKLLERWLAGHEAPVH